MTTHDQILDQALQHHRRGQLQQAGLLYMRLLQQEPGHAWALHWLGVIGCQTGYFQEAVALLQQAIASEPSVPLFYNNLGNALKALDRLPDAIQHYRQALELDPALTDAYNNLGNAYRQQGQLEEAQTCYLQAVAHEPGFAEPLHNLGLILQEQGQLPDAVRYLRQALQHKEAPEIHFSLGNALKAQGHYQAAVQHYQRAVGLNPQFAQAYNHLAHAWQLLGQTDTAIFFYHKAIDCQPQCADFHNNLGNAWQEKQELDQARQAYQQAIALDGQMDEAHNNLGNILYEQGRFAEATAAYQRSLELNPREATVYANQGKTLRAQDRYDEALACYQQALALQSDLAEAHLNIGNIFWEQSGDWREAQQWYDRLLFLRPDYPEARYNRSLILLLQGQLQEGFREYEWRWKCSANRVPRLPELLTWDGCPLQGQTVIVYGEQGYGDILQFARYLPQVALAGGRVVLVCEQKLVRLLQSMPGVTEVVPVEAGQVPRFDFCVSIVSLARIFATTLDTIPATPYLKAEPPSEGAALQPKQAGDLKVGLVWASGYRSDPEFLRLYRQKTCPLPVMAQLCRQSGVSFYSFQVGSHAGDLAQHVLTADIQDLTPLIEDFADTAALLAQMDLLISVDTGIVHLAGGLGQPVWVLLPHRPDWRWMLEREDSPWYPGGMRLFRQSKAGDWEEVIGRVKEALADYAVQKDKRLDP